MLRFYLRLLLLLLLVGLLAVWGVGIWSERHFGPSTQAYFHELTRGMVFELRERLAPLPRAQRPAALAALQPHHGWHLSLRRGAPEGLQAAELAQLAAHGFVQRQEHELLLVPLDADHRGGDWLEVRWPTEKGPGSGNWLLLIIVPVVAAMALALLLWSGLLWRDLRRLRRQSQRLAAGELGSQVTLSRYSELRGLGEQFNTMSRETAAMVEQQRALTRAVSHELRTPVARLLFELQLLRQAADAAQREALIDALHDDVGELDRLITELLNLAQLEQRQQRPAPGRLLAGPWLQGLLAQTAREAGRPELSLELVLPPEPGLELVLHERLLKQALLNLLRNAARHARARICLRLEVLAEGWRLSVEDDGPGIPPQARERVLQPFVRLDEARDRASGGVGLGLSIALRVAQWHDGRLWVDEAALGGAALRLQWPRPA
ncbi:HAMP domain-containing protein [Roseateles sp. DAIF2]|uniref:ATP-binding protein n=1 Tax=Roseateles sp. DAIF2 TaxID=2714952 RepID=UPI0018A2E9F3|nr:ATP-binding protein [Roseateles sp. DAIF2]QPF72331.1 HAMP domain-containing protein [Roseateles sp. DAIF2]